MKRIIEVERLSKSFGKVKAVDDISFYVEEGSLFSFLGTNGAGKSTTIAILLTLLQQDKGHVTVNGYIVGKHDQAIRREIGVVFQDSLLDPLLTVKENLTIRAAFYGMTKARASCCDSSVSLKLSRSLSFARSPLRKIIRRTKTASGHCPRAHSQTKYINTGRTDNRARPGKQKKHLGNYTTTAKRNGHDCFFNDTLY